MPGIFVCHLGNDVNLSIIFSFYLFYLFVTSKTSRLEHFVASPKRVVSMTLKMRLLS